MGDLLLLTIDSLRRDRFTENLFSESWDMFKTDFVYFDNALANGVATPLSFPSILTGHPVTGDGTISPEHPTLAELYDGYTWAMSNNPHLRADRGYDSGFEFFADSMEEVENEKPGSDRSPQLLRSVYQTIKSTITMDDKPNLSPPPNSAEHVLQLLRRGMDGSHGLFWSHFIDPHYQFKPQKIRDKGISTEYTNSEILAMNERYIEGDPNPNDIDFLSRMYDEQIAYLDRQLATFFEHLQDEGRWDETMIVLTADHGESFGEQDIYNHQWDADPVDQLIRIPLLVKYPQNKRGGKTNSHLVQNADILATLSEIFKWDYDWPENTRPLTHTEQRTVISKSTGAVRVTTENGTGIRRRDGTLHVNGRVRQDAMSKLMSASIPAVEKLSGDVPGRKDDDRQAVEKRLERLGYK